MNITGKTIQLGIIGNPVEHSFSPKMHNYISNYMGNDYVYSAFCVKPDNLGEAIAGMRALNIRGINVTAPHKVNVMKYLDEVSPDAQRLGAVNTVVNRNGILTGYNTDSDGFYLALKNAGITVTGSNMLVMGCGGVVMPTLLRLIKERPKSITLLNRTRSKAQLLAEQIKGVTDFEIQTNLSNIAFDIVINTTSAGMEPQIDALPWDNIEELDGDGFITAETSAVDMIYNPAKTRFLQLAEKKGAKILNGLDMLIYQGLLAYELFTDTKLPPDMAQLIRKEVFGV